MICILDNQFIATQYPNEHFKCAEQISLKDISLSFLDPWLLNNVVSHQKLHSLLLVLAVFLWMSLIDVNKCTEDIKIALKISKLICRCTQPFNEKSSHQETMILRPNETDLRIKPQEPGSLNQKNQKTTIALFRPRRVAIGLKVKKGQTVH